MKRRGREGRTREWSGEVEEVKLTGIASVCIGFDGTFRDLEIVFVGELIESVLAAAEELAGIAVAMGLLLHRSV